jgi:hypothetical protein
MVNVTVDGSASHTHGIGLTVTQWIWKVEGTNSIITASGMSPTILIPVGIHTVTLAVIDSGGNESTDQTTITVDPFGYPAITNIVPNRGSIAGNELIHLFGSGFTFSPSETIVHFGLIELRGSKQITIVNATTIAIRSPPTTVGAPVLVTVETPLSNSTAVSFTYIASSEIIFTSGKILGFGSVTTGAFGPDGKLYLGNYNGDIAKLTLNDNYTAVVNQVVVRIPQSVDVKRAVLGIAFDPNDVGQSNPPLYCTSSQFFHGGQTSSSGLSVNGIIHRVSGANLDIFEDIITGLPVSDHDHGRLISRNVIFFVVLSLREIRNSLTLTPTLLTFQA